MPRGFAAPGDFGQRCDISPWVSAARGHCHRCNARCTNVHLVRVARVRYVGRQSEPARRLFLVGGARYNSLVRRPHRRSREHGFQTARIGTGTSQRTIGPLPNGFLSPHGWPAGGNLACIRGQKTDVVIERSHVDSVHPFLTPLADRFNVALHRKPLSG
jgi:hypothetical protein